MDDAGSCITPETEITGIGSLLKNAPVLCCVPHFQRSVCREISCILSIER